MNTQNNVGRENLSSREEWLEKILESIPAGLKILDAGAGELQYKRFCKHLDYTSQDFAEYDGEGDGIGLQTGTWDNSKLDIISDITSIPVDNASFDAVMCIEVLEHVPNPVLAIEELNRVLKNGGYLIITAPFSSFTHFAPYHFSTGFNKYFYEYHLDRLGYEILDMNPNSTFFDFVAQELLRVKSTPEMFNKSELKTIFTEDYDKSVETILNVLGNLKESIPESSEFACFGYHVKAVKK